MLETKKYSLNWIKIKSKQFFCSKQINYISIKCIGGIALLLFLELVSFFTLRLNNFSNFPMPWDGFILFLNGYQFSTLLASLLSSILFYSIYLIYLGGIERIIGKSILVGIILIALINSFAIVLFNFWHQLKLPFYPWVSYQLLLSIPQYSLTWKHYGICLLVSSITITLAVTTKKLIALSPSQNVFGQAHFASAFEISKSGLFAKQGIVIGKAFGKILRLNGYEGVLITAPTGSGKTTAIAIPNLLEWQGSGIFNDLKGELYNVTAKYREHKLGNKCYCWSPASVDMKNHRYNPFEYVSNNPDLQIRDLQLISEIMIPSERIDGGFWYTSSRDIFLMLAIYLIETNGTATLAEIHDLSKQDNFMEWLQLIIEKEKIGSNLFYQSANSLLNSDKKTKKNILKDFHSRLSLFSDPLVRYATSANDFNLRNLRKEKISVYINIPDADKERLKTILTLFWAQCIHLMTDQMPDKNERFPVLALIDEFGNMAKINKLKDGISFLRSYHIRPIIITQYLSQLVSIYGQHDAKSFLNSKVKIAFALNDIDDAKFFSQSLGQKTVKVKSTSASVGQHDSASKSINLQGKALMTADEIMQMKNNDEIILLEAKPPIKAKKCYWFKETIYKYLLKNFNFD